MDWGLREIGFYNASPLPSAPTPTFGGHPGGYPTQMPGPPLSPNRMSGSMMSSSMGQHQRPPPPSYMPAPHMRRGGGGMMGLGMGPMQGGGGMSVLGMGRQSHGGYPGNADHYPPILDPSEFPSLTSRNLGQGDGYHQSLPAKPYGMVKPTQNESTPFTMSSEDFPALPGTTPAPPPPAPMVTNNEPPPTQQAPPVSQPMDTLGSEHGMYSQNMDNMNRYKRGIVTAPDGKVTNIPATMVNDQFGLVGLLTFIRVADTDPNLVSLALGFDLTSLGLNLNATDSLYPTFGGPWGEGPVRSEDIDFTVPLEYNISDHVHKGDTGSSVREKLTPLKMNRYKDELLFYLFYSYPGDVLQILAAAELFNRDWRYHKDEKIWITRAPGMSQVEKGGQFERGMYYFFDPISFRKIAKEFILEYDKLEERPSVPNHFLHAYLAP